MVSTYPVTPLGRGQALSIGLTSYDGGVYYGLYADRDAMPDADVLGRGVVDALQELLEAPAVGQEGADDGEERMPLTRVYLALTADDLAGLAQGRPLGPVPVPRTR